MVTIKDIARLARVSQATVSNVLNRRGNVSSEKIRAVEAACQSLGYVPNERAKALRRGSGRALGLILPLYQEQRHLDFFKSFRVCCEARGYQARTYVPRAADSKSVEAALRTARSDMVSGVALFAGHAAGETQGDLPLLYITHETAETPALGFDPERAGREVAERVLSGHPSGVTLVTGPLSSPGEATFVSTFLAEAERTGTPVHLTQTDERRVRSSLMTLLEAPADPAVVCTQLSFARAAREVYAAFGAEDLPKIYTISPLFTLPEPDFLKYELNYRLLGNEAATRLIAAIEAGGAPEGGLLPMAGFRDFAPAPPARRSDAPLRIITLDTPAARAMQRMLPLYTKATGVPVEMTVCSYDQTAEVYDQLSEACDYDVIRLDATWLSAYAERLLCPLCEIDPAIEGELGRFLPGTIERYARVGGTLYALPGSPSIQLLFYRKDLFESAIWRRLYQERTQQALAVPTSFEQFNRIAAFFSQAENPESPCAFGATMTLGSSGTVGSEYLCRLFAHQENLYDPRDGRIRLNTPEALAAMRELCDLQRHAKATAWWTEAARAFADGQAAMTLLYNNFASPIAGHHSQILGHFDSAMIPGGNPLIGGGAMGISRHSRQKEQALHFLRWLLTEPIASASATLGGTSPLIETYQNYEILDHAPWLASLSTAFTNVRGYRTAPGDARPFDERRFIRLVGASARRALEGSMTPEEATAHLHAQFAEAFAPFAG